MRLSIRQGEAIGLGIMKFTLVYEGELKSNGTATKKHAIREKLHPQLEDLWCNHPCLQGLLSRRYVQTNSGGHVYFEDHHSVTPRIAAKPQGDEAFGLRDPTYIDLCAPVMKGGSSFIPLVRERTALKCALKIIFLRHEEPGRVIQGGDIDNRLKTLLDALSVPQHDEQVVGNAQGLYCLLEDDSLVTGLDVQTQRLLAKPNAGRNDVHLIIEVDVRVTNPRGYNQMFLGD